LLAQISPYSDLTPTDLEAMSDEVLTEHLMFFNRHVSKEYTVVGEVEFTCQLIDADQAISNKAEAIKAEITQTQADAERKITGLREKLQSLLAITHKE